MERNSFRFFFRLYELIKKREMNGEREKKNRKEF